MRRRAVPLFAAGVVVCAMAPVGPVAVAQDQPAAERPEVEGFVGQRVRIQLTNGEVVRGELTNVKGVVLQIAHPVYGDIALDRGMVSKIDLDQGTNTVVRVEQPAPPPPPEPPAEPPPPPPESFFEGWSGSIELGLNGSDGNTERVNVRAGVGALRKSETIETSMNFSSVWAKDDGTNTENRARVDVRNDWLLEKDSPWRVFAKGSFEYDEFQDWDTRVSAFGGLGYEFIDAEKTFLLGRVGAGVTREIGGDENALIPEGLLGLDFWHKLTDRQKISASAEYLPSLQHVDQFRVIGRAAYEILIDPEVNMKFKLGVEDRYDSDPGAMFKHNDFDYFALLAWDF